MAISFLRQSMGRTQLNILSGPFTEHSVRLNGTILTPVPVLNSVTQNIIAGRVAYVNADGFFVLGLERIANPVALPLFIWNNSLEPNTRRDNLNDAGDVELGMMPGGTVSAFRHNAPNELATTEFVGITASTPNGTPLSVYNTIATSDSDETLNGKLRPRAGSEPIVAYLTRSTYRQADGNDVIGFTPTWIPGTYTV